MILVSDGIRFVRIFPEIPRRGASNDSGVHSIFFCVWQRQEQEFGVVFLTHGVVALSQVLEYKNRSLRYNYNTVTLCNTTFTMSQMYRRENSEKNALGYELGPTKFSRFDSNSVTG